MRWQKGRRSSNVEDRRGRRVGGVRGLGLSGGALVIFGIIYLLLGGDPMSLLQMGMESGGPSASIPNAPMQQGGGPQDELADFVSVVLADTEDTWSRIFAENGARYEVPTLVLFTGRVQSACGLNSAAVGPFYCPGDHKLYIDLSFYHELKQRFGAPGDFAQAYVIAHEVGHHVQNLLGISEETRRMRRGMSKAESNALSVRVELQADCFAGVWGHHADRQRQLLEQGDIEEGLRAAAAIGDDQMQRQAGAVVNPDRFTHGSSEQRVRWFRIGLETGQVDSCDTINAGRL
ncbi:MAG: neutral zinc metallopeptidase [Acidobacteriota bacterium]